MRQGVYKQIICATDPAIGGICPCFTIIGTDKLRLFAALIIILPCLVTIHGCKPAKSDRELILDTVNGYMKEHALGNYEESYTYLAPQTRNEVSEDEWVAKQLMAINAIRLMREPSLENITITGDRATAILHYTGISSRDATSAVTSFYSHNFHLPQSEIIRGAEEYLLEHFDELAGPQTMLLSFVKTEDVWKLLLDEKGRPYAPHNE